MAESNVRKAGVERVGVAQLAGWAAAKARRHIRISLTHVAANVTTSVVNADAAVGAVIEGYARLTFRYRRITR
jgi:hypothetical protein